MIKQLYLALTDRIKSFDSQFIANTYSIVKHFDLYFSQYQDTNLLQEHPFELPAIFWEIGADYKLIGNAAQQATVALRVHVVQECYHDTADNSGDKTDALKILDLVDLVHEALQSYSIPNISGKLNRTRLQPESNPSNLYVYVIEYQFTADDNSTHRLKDTIESSGNHGVNLNNVATGGAKIIEKLKNTSPVVVSYTLD